MVSVLRFRGLFILAPRKGGGGPALSRGRVPTSPRRLAPDLALALSRRRFCARAGMEAQTTTYTFGPYKIDRSEVFYSTPLSYAMVNLRPLLPGHILFMEELAHSFPLGDVDRGYVYALDVLVCPRREVKRFFDLSADETSDLWLTAKEVGGRLERYHEASSLTFAIQDGPQAGQTVPHVHIHILPRKREDFEKNDEIYEAIDEKEKELKEKFDLDKERKDRTSEEMACEADEYRALFS